MRAPFSLVWWTTSLDGPLGWTLRDVAAWQYIALWHLRPRRHHGLLPAGPGAHRRGAVWKALAEAAPVTGLAWVSRATRGAGR